MKRKLISLLLAVTMAISMFKTVALAASAEEAPKEEAKRLPVKFAVMSTAKIAAIWLRLRGIPAPIPMTKTAVLQKGM